MLPIQAYEVPKLRIKSQMCSGVLGIEHALKIWGEQQESDFYEDQMNPLGTLSKLIWELIMIGL